MVPEMHIYIPTYGRIDRQTTLQNLPPAWRNRCTLVVRRSEYTAFSARGLDNLMVLPAGVERIAQVRQHIVDTAPYRFVMMLDDDLSFQDRSRWNEEKEYWHLKRASNHSTNLALNAVEHKLKTECAVVGISARNLNPRIKEDWVNNGRIMHALAFDCVAVRAAGARFDKVEVMEDFYFVLSMLTAGYANAVLYSKCVSPAPTNAPGGCSEWRTHKIQEESAHTLARAFPKYVKLRQKNVKGGLGSQTDVTIQWKRAYQGSTKKR